MANPTMVTPDVFVQRTAAGFPVQMDTSIYEGYRFACGCGAEHDYDRQRSGAVREMGGMRLVLPCPVGADALTCVKVKGFPMSVGFETLYGTRGEGQVVSSYLETCERDVIERGDAASMRRRNRWIAIALAIGGLLLINLTAGGWVMLGWVLFAIGAITFFGTTGAPDPPSERSETAQVPTTGPEQPSDVDQLVPALQTLLIPSYTVFLEELPRLGEVDTEQYDFFMTTAAVCSALQGIQARKPELYEEAKRSAEKGLMEAWDVDGPRALLDCNQFVNNAMPSGEIDDIEEAMSAGLGMWIVWNLLGEKPDDAEYRMVRVTGLAAFQAGTPYWL